MASKVPGAVDVNTGEVPNINTSIDAFQQQNMSPSDTFSLGSGLPQTLSGIPFIGSRIPSLGKLNIPILDKIPALLAPLNSARFGKSGAFESVHYADDLNRHHPKFKFLFKVGFYGFPGGEEFYYYVHRCDKPKVKFNHQDVNYYNFRSRVLTSVTYEPLQIQFLDEIGNSVFDFFQAYLYQTSGTGSGNYGIDKGWGDASSTKAYPGAYSFARGQKIVLEQVFIDLNQDGGPRSNRWTFVNPRIETFDFDELTHEESSTGSMANITFSYDAISAETVTDTTIYSWGNTDLFKGGGSSGVQNAGNINGNSMYAKKSDAKIKKPKKSLYETLQKGADMLINAPNALAGLVAGALSPVTGAISKGVSSVTDTVSSGLEGTMDSVSSGANMVFGGKEKTGKVSSGSPPSTSTPPG